MAGNDLAPKRQQTIIWTIDGLIYRRIYVISAHWYANIILINGMLLRVQVKHTSKTHKLFEETKILWVKGIRSDM